MNRKRPRLSQRAVEAMEYIFQKNPYPTDEDIEYASEDSGESIKRVKTWFANRRVKALAELSGKRKPTKRRLTLLPASQRSTPSKTDWRRTSGEQPVSTIIPSASSSDNEVSNKKHVPCKKCQVTSSALDDLLLARYAELIEDKEFHEMVFDSD
ncbi:uncharacterized protein LOC134241976 [Saccostrea cucullata]|uniref:uncharacterized protein LOC134241976 n=1 Tax=Saccostrea cuccullata TaxID=36930 RepID=UPI002ED4C74A